MRKQNAFAVELQVDFIQFQVNLMQFLQKSQIKDDITFKIHI